MASYQYSYVMKDVRKVYPGGREILKGLTLSFLPTAKIGVLGANGAGKSTLLKIMAGKDKDYSGEAWAAEGARVGYLEQEPELDPKLTVEENVMAGLGEVKDLVDRFNELSAKFAEPMDDDEMNSLLAEQGELQEKIDACNGWELERTIEIAMDALRCPPGDADVTKLSGGERRRVALGRLLLQKPDILLLDEPTNHLDVQSRQALIQAINSFAGAVVIVSHDPHVIELTADRLWLVTDGSVTAYDGDMEDYRSLLLGKRKSTNGAAKEEPAPIATVSAAPLADRKEQRRLAAERRKALSPLRSKLQRAEKNVARLEDEKAKIVQAMADPALYDGDNGKLVDLQRQHGYLDRDIAAAEEAWLALQEEWDAAEAVAEL